MATLLISIVRSEPPVFTVQVQSGVDGALVEVATVRIGEDLYRSDTAGEERVHEPEAGTAIEVVLDGYRSVSGSVEEASANHKVVSLRPSIVQGTIRDSASGAPIASAKVSAIGDTGVSIACSVTAPEAADA